MILQGVLNRLLQHSPAATAVLVPLAGRNVRVETPLKHATLVITDEGCFGKTAAEPEAVLILPLSFFIIRTHDPIAAARQIECAGDVALGSDVGRALALLRWDAAEELSVLVGDVLAQRLIGLAGAVGGIPGAIGSRLLKTYAEYWRDENPLLPSAEDVEHWQNEVGRLQESLAKLEARIRNMELTG